MIVTRPDIGFLRTDDDFILRFLRARKFDQVETFRLLAQYFQFRQQNLDMFQSFKVCSNKKLQSEALLVETLVSGDCVCVSGGRSRY